MPAPSDYLGITGSWQKSSQNPFDLLSCLGLHGPFGDYVQLVQTYSRCDLEPFNPSFPLDFQHLEQYRAFGPDWELWLRHVNAAEVRFRFIFKTRLVKGDAHKVLSAKGFVLEAPADCPGDSIDIQSYPLVGEPLRDEEGRPLGWYAERIPRLLHYPVSLTPVPGGPKGVHKTLLTVENFRRADGSVALVRYTGLRVQFYRAIQSKDTLSGDPCDGN